MAAHWQLADVSYLAPLTLRLLPRAASAAPASRRSLAEGRGRLLRAVIAASIVLPDDYRIALMNIVACYFRYTSVSQACANKAGLNRFPADHNPDHLALSSLPAFAAR